MVRPMMGCPIFTPIIVLCHRLYLSGAPIGTSQPCVPFLTNIELPQTFRYCLISQQCLEFFMLCLRCGRENAQDAVFCNICGAQLDSARDLNTELSNLSRSTEGPFEGPAQSQFDAARSNDPAGEADRGFVGRQPEIGELAWETLSGREYMHRERSLQPRGSATIIG